MARPNWVKCVAHPHVDRSDAWCGRKLSDSFHFVSADHAALNGEQKGRLVACRDCTDQIIVSITEGQPDE